MAVCVSVVTSSLQITSTAIGSCTDYVLLTAADYSAMTPQLTIDDAVTLAWSVVAVWAVAWSIRIIAKAL